MKPIHGTLHAIRGNEEVTILMMDSTFVYYIDSKNCLCAHEWDTWGEWFECDVVSAYPKELTQKDA